MWLVSGSRFQDVQTMRRRGYTDMGGVGEAFLTTHWSLIQNVQSKDEGHRALMGLLIERYWKPVYCYLRHRGYDNEKAKDLTQGFFHEIVLGRELIQHANQAKGRFRKFLLVALERYLTSQHRQESAAKRRPKGKLHQLKYVDPADLPGLMGQLTPEESFNYAWTSILLDQLLKEVETACHRQGMTTHWQVFHDKILQPIMEETQAPSLKDLCSTYGIENPIKASNMIISVNRRFQATLKRRLRQSVTSDPEVYGELKELMEIFVK